MSLDVIRVIAIFMVVICHATEICYPMNLESWKIINKGNQLFRILAFTVGRMGVPLFLFLSGTLILNKIIKMILTVTNFIKNFTLFIDYL